MGTKANYLMIGGFVLGVLVITGEYSTGMIRASFIAVPKRLPVLWAKTGVFAGSADPRSERFPHALLPVRTHRWKPRLPTIASAPTCFTA